MKPTMKPTTSRPLPVRTGFTVHRLTRDPGRGDVPRRLHRLWWWIPALLTAGALVAGAFLWLNPSSLGSAHLEGDRGPGCVRLVIAADASGSMEQLAEPRRRAVQQLLAWAPDNLRPDDELAVIEFAGDAAVQRRPSPIGVQELPSDIHPSTDGTRLTPVLDAVGGFEHSPCRTSLLLLSDGRMSDLPDSEATATRELTRRGVHRIDLIVPGQVEVQPDWTRYYPTAPPDFFDGNDPDDTAVTIARHVAGSAGQALRRTF